MQAMNVLLYAVKAVSSTAVALPTIPTSAKRVYITTETDAVRWRADGTAPTDSVGHLLPKDDSISFTGANYRSLLDNIKFIRVTTDASLKITYFD